MKLILARLSTLLVLMMVIVSGSSLFWVSQKVQQLERQQKSLTAQIAEEKEGIRVLTAEWDYLNRPDRLETLVRSNLDLEQARPESVRNDTSELPEPFMPIIPARKPAYSSPVVKAIPAVLAQPSLVSPSISSQALPRPAAPQSPDNNFKKLLNELAPAGGDE